MVDLFTVAVSVPVGLALGGLVTYYVFYSRPRKTVAATAPQPMSSSSETMVTSAALERSKRDMRTIMVERDLLSSAMMKLYEAENEGRITREEREMISKRYSDQIKDLQSKLKDVELVVEVGELENLRNELVTLFEQKIQNIETRLDSAKQRMGPPLPTAAKKEVAPRTERVTELEKVVEKRAKPEMSEAERRMKELREEVMDQIEALEQIDIDKKQEN